MSYTRGMKIAVSIPDEVFDQAERLAADLGTSRSALYARALTEYLANHDSDRVTERMNEVVAELDPKPDGFANAAAVRILEEADW